MKILSCLKLLQVNIKQQQQQKIQIGHMEKQFTLPSNKIKAKLSHYQSGDSLDQNPSRSPHCFRDKIQNQ